LRREQQQNREGEKRNNAGGAKRTGDVHREEISGGCDLYSVRANPVNVFQKYF
jgi:hypothetical protein